MEICNSYYLIPNEKNQDFCIDWLKIFFNPEIDSEKENRTVVVKIPTNVNWTAFEVEYKNNKYMAFYKTYYGNARNTKDAGFYLDIKIDYNNNKRKYAEILSFIIQKLKINKKNNFYLVVLNDELSRYFAEISYKSLSIYERMLRRLLLVITTPMDGKNWSGNFEINKKSLNSKEKNSIEQGLEELDLSELEALFFEPTVNFDEHNYDNKFSIKNIENLSKNEIIRIIKNNKPNSFWNRHIQRFIQIDSLTDRMQNIRNQRNKIAHNKYFSSEDQKKFMNDVQYVSKKINEAIKEIIMHKEKFNIEVMNIDLSPYKKIMEITEQIMKQYTDILPQINFPDYIKHIPISMPKNSFPFIFDEYEDEKDDQS
ncbi:hypothetical protein [Enterococcus mundtii]|uniref:hypothetical protein n=1 Tax=Enterococcus mundtii TaxID=53346 RepID=UPI00403C8B59